MGKVRIIRASAGSGKTFTLAYSYILRVIREPSAYRHILAVTFTNKATEEMKRRILSELNDLAVGAESQYMEKLAHDTGYTREQIAHRALRARTAILHDYSRFSILTIDKFFQRIIRSFIKELGVDLNFNLELQTDSLVAKTADALIERLSEEESLRRWISGYIEERIDGNMRWDIKSGLASIGQELFRENFKKIAADIPPMDIIRDVLKKAGKKYDDAVGTMQRYAREALEIMEGSGLAVEDFVYGRGGVAGYIGKIARGQIEDYGPRVAKALEADEAWCSKSSAVRESILYVAPHLREKLAAICGTYRDNDRFFATYELLKDNYRRFALLGDLARIMEEICTRESIMPISETNHILGKLIAGNDSPFIFEKAGERYDTFMIDEFQDTSTMQWENFLPLLRNALAQSDEEPVLLVGDVKQSIYRWRGGDWRILAQGVGESFRGAADQTLATNWRSRPNVVGFNNRLIGSIVGNADAEMRTLLAGAVESGTLSAEKFASLDGVIARAYRDCEQQPSGKLRGGHVSVSYYGIEQEEAVPPVIRQVRELQDRGFRAGDIAVLVRRNAEGVAIADMLLEQKVNEPDRKYCYDVVTQEALTIGSSPVANFVVACFRLAAGDEDIPEKVFYNRFLDRPFGMPLPDGEREFILSLGNYPVMEAFDRVVIRYGLRQPADTAYLQALHDQILSWTSSRVGDLPLFVKWWDESGARQSINAPAGSDAITIVSIHKSKGLEYPAVIIPWCDWSLTPHARSLVWTASDEERFGPLGNVPVAFSEKMGRSFFSQAYYQELVLSCVDNINLLYVALTRARDELHIMMPRVPKPAMKISSLIHSSLDADGMPDELSPVTRYLENELRLEFGEPVQKKPDEKAGRQGPLTLPFFSYTNEVRIKQKRSYLRFEEEGASASLTPRDQGILLHRVFERAETARDIFTAIEAWERDGEMTPEERNGLEAMVRAALADPVVARWFDGKWQRIYKECDIITPGSLSEKRPDRVMECEREVVVVDYKFGAIRDDKHRKQVTYYKNLLGQMTGKPTRGFIWYVTLNEVTEVA